MPTPIGPIYGGGFLAPTAPPAGGGGGHPNYMAMFGLGSGGRPAGGGAGNLPGTTAYNYDPRFGGIPGVPSPGGTQQQAISSNIGNLGSLYNLGSSLNQFTAQQAPTSLNLNLPNYQQNLATQSQDVMSKLKGQIPQDVANQLQQFGAERGVGTGSIGSPNSEAATLRALGLTSLDIQNQGMQQFGQQIAQTPQGAQFNPFNFLITPEQQQQAQYQANLLNAAPVPSSAQYAGLNAFQQGRGQGFQGFPSSAPSSGGYTSPYSPGQQPLGSWAGPRPYSGGYADEFFPGLDVPGSSDYNFQTGDPASQSPGWGEDFFG